MGDNAHSCMLGRYWRTDKIPASEGMLARYVYHADFVPSNACLELMNRVAQGIEGIEAVVRTCTRGTTFALVFDAGTAPSKLVQVWNREFRNACKATDLLDLVGATRTFDPDKEQALLYGSRGF